MDWAQVLEIQQVLSGYFRALDERNFDVAHLRRLFTPDAKVVRPNGAETVGPEAIGASHAESMARFSATQHLLLVPDVVLDGDAATARANLVAMHLWAEAKGRVQSMEDCFVAGGVIVARLVRTPEGWKISNVENRVVWRGGGGFERLLQTK